MLLHWKALGKLPRAAWILSATILVNRCGTMVIPFLVLYLTQKLQMTVGHAGLVVATYGAGALITAPIGGRLADRFGHFLMLWISLLGSAVILLAYPFFRSYEHVLILTFILGLVNEIFRPVSMAVMGMLVPAKDRKQGFVLMRLAINLGMGIGPALGGFLSTVSYNWLFIVNATTAISAAIVMIICRGDMRLVAESPAAEKTTEHKKAMAITRLLGLRALHDPVLLYFLVALFPIALIFFQIDSALALYVVNELKLTGVHFGLLTTVNTTLILIFEVSLNHLTAHWSHRRVMTIGAVLWGAGFASLMFASNFLTLAMSVTIWTVAEMISLPAASAYVSEISPPQRQGEYMGMFSLCFGVAYVVAPGFGTQIMQHFGSVTLWAATGVLGIFSALLFARLKK